MKNAYVDVAKLDSLEDVGIARKACKLSEETGELMQVVCRYVGMKSNQMSSKEMLEEAFGEVADVIQNCFCIANQFNITAEDLPIIPYKVSKTKLDLETLSTDGVKLFTQVGKVIKVVDNFLHKEISKEKATKKLKTRLLFAIESTLIIAQELGIKFEDIEPKILEKNKKWMLRIEKKHLKKKK